MHEQEVLLMSIRGHWRPPGCWNEVRGGKAGLERDATVQVGSASRSCFEERHLTVRNGTSAPVPRSRLWPGEVSELAPANVIGCYERQGCMDNPRGKRETKKDGALEVGCPRLPYQPNPRGWGLRSHRIALGSNWHFRSPDGKVHNQPTLGPAWCLDSKSTTCHDSFDAMIPSRTGFGAWGLTVAVPEVVCLHVRENEIRAVCVRVEM